MTPPNTPTHPGTGESLATEGHTPGPWRCEPDQYFGPGFVITAPGMHSLSPVVRMSSPLGADDETLEADARLIAAAPDLLAACKAFVAAVDHACLVEDDNQHAALADPLRAALSAIARAEGRE